MKLDVPSQKVNTWTDAALDDFARTFGELEERKKELKGVLFRY